MSSSADTGSRTELTFVSRRGRTVLARSRVEAPTAIIRPFSLADGRQLVQLITLGPGFCGGDRIHLRITAGAGAGVIVTTTAATRVLSMHPGTRAEQHVEIVAERDSTIEYYPAVTIPFPESAFVQMVNVRAARGARVGVMETWALGRAARGEYLQFRTLSNRTTLHVDGVLTYVDATELDPQTTPLAGAAVLAGRRYLASGFWYGATIAPDPPDGASADDLLLAFDQSRSEIVYLRTLASDAVVLDAALKRASGRIADAWNLHAVALDRFRC